MNMRTHTSFLLLLGAVAGLAACDKNVSGAGSITEPPPGGAGVKFFNFAVGAPQVNFFADDRKLTGVGATTGTAYGNSASGGLYNDLTPGQYTFKAQIAGATDLLGAATTTVGPAAFYSYYLSGLYDATTKTADSFVLEDALPPWDYANTYVRFVNAMYNAQPLTLFAKNTITAAEVQIGGPTAYKAGSGFVALPPGAYDLRAVQGGTDLIVRTGVSFAVQRVYTIGARGDVNTGSTRALDNTANR
jgi:hypothetical protein